MIPHYAVLGHPVAHSLSPRIHAQFARASGIELTYVAIDTAGHGFDATLARFAQAGGVGANVTVPDKVRAAEACATLGARAQKLHVVNTLVRNGLHWHGETTDGIGLLQDLRVRRGIDLHDMRVLLIGAGGAARSVALSLAESGIAQLLVANRKRAPAYDLIDMLPERVNARACTLQELAAHGSFDLIVHSTSAGHAGVAPTLPEGMLDTHTVAVDLSYGRAAMPFLTWARARGCTQAVDGLGMLVEQAAESFALWHGVRPETDAVYASLRMASV